MNKHQVHLQGTRVGNAAMEILDDRVADVIRHYQDANTSGKESKVTLEVTIKPVDDHNQQFKMTVSGSTRLSARKTYESTIFGGINAHDEVEVAEYNPQQLAMFAPLQNPEVSIQESEG